MSSKIPTQPKMPMDPEMPVHTKMTNHPDTKGTKDIKTGFQSSPGSVPEKDQARVIDAQPPHNELEPKSKSVKTSPRG